jgi:hypothetical protein
MRSNGGTYPATSPSICDITISFDKHFLEVADRIFEMLMCRQQPIRASIDEGIEPHHGFIPEHFARFWQCGGDMDAMMNIIFERYNAE